MKRLFLMVIAGLLILGLGATVYARAPQWRGSSWADGMCWKGSDLKNLDIEKVKKFQKETLALRDELQIKKLELRAEYAKETPDLDRIAELRKEIVDLQTRIQKTAQKYDLVGYGPGCGMAGGGMHHRGPMVCGCQGMAQKE